MDTTRTRRVATLATLFCLVAVPPVGLAAWQLDGTPLCQEPNPQQKPVLAPDGAGGAIVVWNDQRASGTVHLYAQRVDPAGEILWAHDGIAVCSTSPSDYQSAGNAVSDGAGGAIVVWKDRRNGSDVNIYAQRLNGQGAPQWTAGGVAVCAEPSNQDLPRCAADGAGGVVIAWMDLRNGDPDIYAQRLSASGMPQWMADGVNVSSWTSWPAHSEYPDLAPDGAGGAIIVWQEGRYYDYDIYAQRVAGNGAVLWAAGGVAVSQPSGHQREPRVIADGAGGAILAWSDGRPGATAPDIYAQRVNGSGTPQWATDGVALCLAPNDQVTARIMPAAGGAIVAWTDARAGAGNADVYGQLVNGAGIVQWTAAGAAFCTAAGNQGLFDAASDGAGGALAMWMDDRGGVAAEDVYAQRLDAAGIAQWTHDGVRACGAGGRQCPQGVIADGAGGMIGVWVDERAGFGQGDIYALRLDASGTIPASGVGDPLPACVTLLSCSPNPFADGTLIRFELSRPRTAALRVVDAGGRRLRDLAVGPLAPGLHAVVWDGRDDAGRPLPGGVYFLQFEQDRAPVRQRLVRIH